MSDDGTQEIRTKSKTGGQKGVKMRRYDLIPPVPLAYVADVYGMGAEKYDDTNWVKGYKWRYSWGAMMRHLELARSGEWIDKESGLPHLAHVVWHCFTLMFWHDQPDKYEQFNDLPWG